MPGVNIYRPNKDIAKGSAFQFKPGFDKRERMAIFVEAVNQTGPKPPPGSSDSPFDWKQKIIMMLNVDEVAELAASIRGLSRKKIEYTHQTGEGDKSKVSYLSVAPSTNKEYDNWAVHFSVKTVEGVKTVNGFISPGQLYQVLHLIDLCIERNLYLEKTTKKVEATAT